MVSELDFQFLFMEALKDGSTNAQGNKKFELVISFLPSFLPISMPPFSFAVLSVAETASCLPHIYSSSSLSRFISTKAKCYICVSCATKVAMYLIYWNASWKDVWGIPEVSLNRRGLLVFSSSLLPLEFWCDGWRSSSRTLQWGWKLFTGIVNQGFYMIWGSCCFSPSLLREINFYLAYIRIILNFVLFCFVICNLMQTLFDGHYISWF